MSRLLPLLAVILVVVLVVATGCLPVPAEVIQKAVASKGNAPPPPPGAAQPAGSGVEVVSAPAPPGIGTTAPITAASTSPTNTSPTSGRLWVVVKNLKVTSGFGLESEIAADWEVVQGSPDPGARYVLRVSDGDSGSIVERYVDFDVNLSQRSGTVRGSVRGPTFGIRGGIIAAVGKSGGLGRDELDLVSGKCRIGGQSEAMPPPTVAEAAGQAAQGMPIAIANPRHEGRGIGAPRGGWAVDYEVQGTISPGERYFWIVADGSGDSVEFDVTSDLAFPGRAKKGTFSGSAIGPGRLGGQLKMHIERRGFGFRGESTIVSNSVTLN
jgi:hypothetical protein